MEKANSITFRLEGRYALFSDPLNRMGGEKFTYQVPTYQALVGIAESIYWKPTFRWIVDKVRVLHPSRSESKGIRPLVYGGGNPLSVYTYLTNVSYEVQVHFEWNENRANLAHDRNENKHYFMAKRSLQKGGRRDIYLGTRECQGYVEPCTFGESESCYDGSGEIPLGVMFHGFTYPGDGKYEEEKEMLSARFWAPVMKDGVICFPRPEECTIVRPLFKMEMKQFGEALGNFSGLAEFGGDDFELDE